MTWYVIVCTGKKSIPCDHHGMWKFLGNQCQWSQKGRWTSQQRQSCGFWDLHRGYWLLTPAICQSMKDHLDTWIGIHLADQNSGFIPKMSCGCLYFRPMLCWVCIVGGFHVFPMWFPIFFVEMFAVDEPPRARACPQLGDHRLNRWFVGCRLLMLLLVFIAHPELVDLTLCSSNPSGLFVDQKKPLKQIKKDVIV